MANACACGCGELLPEESTRQYKRGHKTRVNNPENDFTEIPADGDREVFTLDDAARETQDDAPPKDQPDFKAPKPAVRITASVKKDIEGKVAFGLMVTGQMWAMTDPLCGNTFLDMAPDVAKKLTPILCQSPDVVRMLTKSGTYIMWVELIMALAPVFQMVFAHHVAKTVGVQQFPNGYTPVPESEYVVQ